MNKIARSNRGKDVLSFAREHAWQPRDGSKVCNQIAEWMNIRADQCKATTAIEASPEHTVAPSNVYDACAINRRRGRE